MSAAPRPRASPPRVPGANKDALPTAGRMPADRQAARSAASRAAVTAAAAEPTGWRNRPPMRIACTVSSFPIMARRRYPHCTEGCRRPQAAAGRSGEGAQTCHPTPASARDSESAKFQRERGTECQGGGDGVSEAGYRVLAELVLLPCSPPQSPRRRWLAS